jgi:hypothetical protein
MEQRASMETIWLVDGLQTQATATLGATALDWTIQGLNAN